MVRDILGQAYSSIKHNRRRTALTMLGMAWGIATVVILLAYGAGFGRAITAIFSTFGMQMMGVFPGRTSLQAGGAKAGTQVRFTIDDVQHLQEQIPVVRHITPEASFETNVQHENRTQKFNVGGFTPAIVPVRALKTEQGRFYNDADEMQRSRVAVLGSDAKDKLFSGEPALGESVRIAGISFEVIGVLEPKMQEEGNDNVNAIVYIPFSTMGDIRDTRYLDGIWLDYDGMEYDKVEGNIRSVLGLFHGFNAKDPRAVFVWNTMKNLNNWQIITLALQVLLTIIGTLTLGIGGVGLMNIMLVSVTQRTREIGVEKALGAHRWHILFQFLAEALVITALGGLLGVVLAYLVSWSVGSLTLWSAFEDNASEGDIHLYIDSATLIWSTAILSFVGIISGMLPAIKAARLNPIEALRYE